MGDLLIEYTLVNQNDHTTTIITITKMLQLQSI